MNVVLVHPIHGAKIAICEAEILHDEKLGWTRYNPDAPVEKPADTAVLDDVIVKRKYARRSAETEQNNGLPNFLAPVSDDLKGT